MNPNSQHLMRYELIYYGPVDDSANTMRQLRATLVGELRLPIKVARRIIDNAPFPVGKSRCRNELMPYYKALEQAGAKVALLVRSDCTPDQQNVHQTQTPITTRQTCKISPVQLAAEPDPAPEANLSQETLAQIDASLSLVQQLSSTELEPGDQGVLKTDSKMEQPQDAFGQGSAPRNQAGVHTLEDFATEDSGTITDQLDCMCQHLKRNDLLT